MPSLAPRGQALPEYVLLLAAFVVVALLGVQAVRHSLASAEDAHAFYLALPSP